MRRGRWPRGRRRRRPVAGAGARAACGVIARLLRQAARGDDRGAEQVIERPGQVRACGAGEGGPGRFGPLQAGQFLAGGAGRGGDAGEKAGQPCGADPQGETVVELDRRGPEGEGDVAAEAGIPPEAGGEEHPVRGERIGVALPVHPVPGAVPRADQRRTPIAPAGQVQPLLDRRVVDRDGPAQGGEGFPHGRGIGDRPPGAVLGEPAPKPRQAECTAGHLIGRARCRAWCPARSWLAVRHRGGRPSRRRCTNRSRRRRAGRDRAGEPRYGCAPASRRPPGRRRGRAGPPRRRAKRLRRTPPAGRRHPGLRRAAAAADAYRDRRRTAHAASARRRMQTGPDWGRTATMRNASIAQRISWRDGNNEAVSFASFAGLISHRRRRTIADQGWRYRVSGNVDDCLCFRKHNRSCLEPLPKTMPPRTASGNTARPLA